MVTTQLFQLFVICVSLTCSLFAILLMGLLHYSDHPHKRNLIFTFRLRPLFVYLKWVNSSLQKFFDQKELTYLAFKITSLKFLKCNFFYVGVYCTLYKGFHIFAIKNDTDNLPPYAFHATGNHQWWEGYQYLNTPPLLPFHSSWNSFNH